MTVLQILKHFREKQIALGTDDSGENLKLKGNLKAITPSDKEILVANKQVILQFLNTRTSETIEVLEQADDYAVSPSQYRMWVLNKIEDGAEAYNMPILLKKKGTLNLDQYIQAIEYIVDRHEILRTIFRETSPAVVRQEIGSRQELGFQVTTLKLNGEKEVDRYFEEHAFLPFDLEKGPLLRVSIIQYEQGQYAIFLNMHHIISDGWSIRVLADEIEKAYQQILQEGEVNWSPLRIQYKDYSAWKISQLDRIQGEKEYWTQQLQGELPVLDLPLKGQRPAIQTYKGKLLGIALRSETVENIRGVVKQGNGTAFATLLSGLYLIFSRYTRQDEFIIGTPVAGRENKDLLNQIGYYVNTLALRCKIEEEETFKSLYSKVNATVNDALRNQNYPFDKLLEDLQVKRDLSRSPIFDAMITYQEYNEASGQFEEEPLREGEVTELEGKFSKFNCNFIFSETAKGYALYLEYNTDLFEDSLMIQMIQDFERLLNNAIQHPEKPVWKHDLFSCEKCGVGDSEEVPFESVIASFEDQVKKNPKHIALVHQGKNYTYETINGQANGLAAQLIEEYRIKQGDKVGVSLDKGVLQIVAFLSILKAGGVYVPLDASYPKERISYMIKDSGCEVILTREQVEKTEASNIQPEINVRGEDPLYVIYTSGSTGQPKGIEMPNRSIVNLIFNQQKVGTTIGTEKILQFTNISFDVSVQEICTALMCGGTLYIPEEEVRNDQIQLFDFIRKNQISTLFFPTALMKGIMSEKTLLEQIPEYVKDIVVAGEQLVVTEHALEFFRGHQMKLHNHYGPAETHVVTIFTLDDETSETVSMIPPIGVPVPNVSVQVLDKNQKECPVHVTGEIYLGGVCLANGYVGKKELTNERFITINDTRYYKTGDLGRWNKEGGLEYIGRTDDQVKIRGYRVEPGEIEVVLKKQEQVSSCIVFVHESILYAFFEGTASSAEIRAFLSKKLPAYMVPEYLEQVSRIPLNANGKVDIKALLQSFVPHQQEESALKPASQLEQEVWNLFEETLGHTPVGTTSSFFDMGGNSIKATILLSKIKGAFQSTIRMKEFFLYPTIQWVAAEIDQKDKAAESLIQHVDLPEQKYPLSAAQKRMWLLSKLSGGNGMYSIPMTLELPNGVDHDKLEGALNQVVERHEVLRTVFKEDDQGNLYQEILPAQLEMKRVEITSSTGGLQSFINQEIECEFDLENGPLFRAFLLREADREVLFCNVHHIIADGWSMNVLKEDLWGAYFDNKKEPLLIQYRDYAVWQNQMLEQEEYQNQRAYWSQLFWGEIPVLNISYDLPRPAVKDFQGELLATQLPTETVEQLKEFCQIRKGTLFMGLLTAYYAVLNKYSGQAEIVVGTPIAGRNHAGLENQVGCYVNTLALKTAIQEQDTFDSLFDRVMTRTTEAYDHQDFPFDVLVDELKVERDSSRSPLFDVMLTLQNFSEEHAEITVKESEIVSVHKGYSKFDLNFIFCETPDGLQMMLEYNTGVMTRSFADRMMNHMLRMIQQMVASPKNQLQKSEYLSPEERDQVLYEFNRRVLDYEEQTFLKSFHQRVLQAPKQIAVRDGEEVLTYKTLDQVSDGLAAYLQKEKGVSKGDFVGVHLKRGASMLTAILAVLKCGAAYVPMDPASPKGRIDFMEQDAHCKTVINATLLNEASYYKGIFNSEEVALNDTAYVIYTSGTTGKPKGVVVSYKGLANLCAWHNEYYGVSQTSIATCYAPVAFDATVWEIFPALSTGATLVVIPDEIRLDMDQVLSVLKKQKVTHSFIPTPVYEELVKQQKDSELAGMKIYVGGDRLHTIPETSDYELYNNYGPTENSVVTTAGRVLPGASNITIGRPIYNVQVYILDPYQNPVPVGIEGELWISGNSLAEGYLNNETLTVDRFVENPFQKGTKMYRSGDVGKWTVDGEIEFIGRSDNQVKIRGYRVEIGEIESSILEVFGVDRTLVVVRDQKLIAYYTGSVSVQEVKYKLEEVLPGYMIPDHFMVLDAFKENTNGKIDIPFLPLPVIEKGRVEPRTETEKRLQAIWQELLGVQEVGITDHFFEVGGNSLLVIKMHNILKKEFEIDIKVTSLFRYTNIESLGQFLDQTTPIQPVLNDAEELDEIDDVLEMFEN